MISIKGNGTEKRGMLRAVMTGAVVASIVCCVGALIGPIFIQNEYCEPQSMNIISIIFQVIGAFVGALVAGMSISNMKWVAAVGSTGLFLLVMICCGILFFNCDPAKVIVSLLACAVSVICSLIVLFRKKKTQIHRRTKQRYR